MPTNVTIEYANAEKKFHNASTPETQLTALYEMQRTAPSHKGAEKLRAEISRKIRRMRDKIDKNEAQRKKASSRSIAVKKEGIGQIALVGAPNAGKSTLLKALSNADVEIAFYPFTTKQPVVGMLDFMNARIQLVEIPPIIRGSASGRAMGRELFSIIRTADAVVLVLDPDEAESEFARLKEEFRLVEMSFNTGVATVSIDKSQFRGISIFNPSLYQEDLKELKRFLRSRGFSNSKVVFRKKASMDEIRACLEIKMVSKRALAVILEKPGSKLDKKFVKSLKKEMDVEVIDLLNEKKVEKLKKKLFGLLDRVLVLTKKPGKKVADKPMDLPLGATVWEAARTLHKDFEKSFRYAKVWGSAKYQGQRVSKDYELKNGDLVEIYG